jgi:benzoate-CoA ligase family protein
MPNPSGGVFMTHSILDGHQYVGATSQSTGSAAAGPVYDPVPWDSPGALEIGFDVRERYNASEILFQNLVEGRGEHLAVTGPGGQRSYAQLCDEAARWGNALLSLGLVRGDRVVLFLDDTPVYPAAFFGAVRAGLVPVLVNLLTPPDLLQFYLSDAAAKVAIADAAFCDRIDKSACTGTCLKTLVIANGEACPDVRPEIRIGTAWLSTFSKRLQPTDTHRNEMAFWMYSSGSTGRPKAIVHLQHDMPYTACSYSRHILKLTAQDVCFSVPKIFFSYGFSNSITYPYSVGAASLLIPGQPNPAAVFAAISQYRPTVFFGLPTLYTMLAKAPEAANADTSSLRLAISAAEILSTEIFNAWRDLTGLEIIEGLGSTEAQNIYLSNTAERKKLGAAGMRVPGYELALKDRDGNDTRENQEGILWVRGQSNTPLFWNCPQKTSEIVRQQGWLCTGDRFACDTDGFYFFRGRDDELVKISGQWVHPVEVQCCLSEHPSVRECAVLAIEMPDRRLTLKAFVVLDDRCSDLDKMTRKLQNFVKQKLLPHKYPRIVQFMRDLPKTGTGKIDRQALLQTDQERFFAETSDRKRPDTTPLLAEPSRRRSAR